MTAAAVVGFDPLRDVRHRDARAARDQADWLAWLELGGTRPRTLSDYEWATAFLLRAFPDKALDEFTDGDLALVLRDFPPRSRRVRQAAYASWFKWALRSRRIEKNPVDLLPEQRRMPQRVIEVFTDPEIAALESLPSPDGPLMVVLFEAGIRKGEARRLKQRDCNLNTGDLIIREAGAKGGKERTVPMTAKLQSTLAEFFLVEGVDFNDHLWYDRPGGGKNIRRTQPIGESPFHRWWERCLAAALVEHRKPHTTRHTCATRWRRMGLELDEIQLLMGHASIRTTSDLYVHTRVEQVAERLRSLEKI